MNDHYVLQHLLDLESQAADLVNNAQAEADKRVSDGEKQNSARYKEAYAREVQTLEKSCAEKLTVVKEDYRKQLEVYRKNLETMPRNKERFFSLAEEELLAAIAPSGGA